MGGTKETDKKDTKVERLRETRLGERPTSARARCSECFVEVWRAEMDCGLRAERPGVDV